MDRAVGFRAANESNVTFVQPPSRASAGQGDSTPPPSPPPLRVLLAAREAHRLTGLGDRLVVNQEELLGACSRGTVSVAGRELQLQCRLMAAGLAMPEQSASTPPPCSTALEPRALPRRVSASRCRAASFPDRIICCASLSRSPHPSRPPAPRSRCPAAQPSRHIPCARAPPPPPRQ